MAHHLEQAIEFIKAGNMEEARKILELVIREDRHDLTAWKLYADTWPVPRERRQVWELCLRHNPGNPDALHALGLVKPTHLPPTNTQPKTELTPPGNAPVQKPADRSSQWLVSSSMVVFIAMIVVAVVAIITSAPLDPEKYRHVQPVDYYLYVPKGYTADQDWPLFVGIHGAGGTGPDCWNLWQKYAEDEGFILLCPSIPGDANGFYQDVGEQTVWSAVGEVKKEYRIQQRMFLSGFSAGAYFIQGFTVHYPQYVRALAIHASGMYVRTSMFMEYVPMLVVIGGRDHPTALQNSLLFSASLQNKGFDVQYVLLPEEGHVVTGTGVNLTIDLFRKVTDSDG